MTAIRLGWLDATVGDSDLDPLWSLLTEQVQRQAGVRATVHLGHTDLSTGGVRSLPNRLMNDAAVLAAAITFADRVDALVLGCWAAPTTAVRAAVAVPVTGLAEASLRIAPLAAETAAIVTVAPGLIPVLEHDLDTVGHVGLLTHLPVRSWHPETTHLDMLAGITDPGPLIDRFETAAEAAVDNGADAIIVGCGYLAAVLAAHDYRFLRSRPAVAVIDCNALAVEQVLMMTALNRSGVLPTPETRLTPQQRNGLDTARAAVSSGAQRGSQPRRMESA